MRQYWLVTGYYGSEAKPPRREGDLAIQVRCYSESVRDLEIKVMEERSDIGEVVTTVGTE